MFIPLHAATMALVVVAFSTFSFPAVDAAATTSTMSPSLLTYADISALASLDEINYHYGPGHVTFTSTSVRIDNWNVSTSDPATFVNRIFIPMDLAGYSNVYYALESVTVSGWLDLEAGTSVKGINVEVMSDLMSDGSAGSALHELGISYVVPSEGSDGAGYVGPFSTTADFSSDETTAAAEKTKLCSGVVSWDMALMVSIDMLPSRSVSPKGMVGSTGQNPMLITLDAAWHGC